MSIVHDDGQLQVHHGDCLLVMPLLDADSIDAIVTDPPYDLVSVTKRFGGEAARNTPAMETPAGAVWARKARGFMGQTWDGTAIAFDPETWRAALRVAKPGAYLLAFGGPRTVHRMTTAIEDAGWEIRDCLVWAYAQGFPKSHNLPGGLGTALKPAWEPIVMARKPLPGTVAANVAAYGTGALNIGDTLLPVESHGAGREGEASAETRYTDRGSTNLAALPGPRGGNPAGRWPANVLLTDPIFDGGTPGVVGGGEQSGGGNPRWRSEEASAKSFGGFETGDAAGFTTGKVPVDTAGTYSRFFLIPKAGRRERNAGLEGREEQPMLWSSGTKSPGTFQSPNTKREARNPHPTVKPVELMDHLVRLVTPRRGLVLDPFLGSDSTAVAALGSGRRCIGIEQEAMYAGLAVDRLRLLRGEAIEAVS